MQVDGPFDDKRLLAGLACTSPTRCSHVLQVGAGDHPGADGEGKDLPGGQEGDKGRGNPADILQAGAEHIGHDDVGNRPVAGALDIDRPGNHIVEIGRNHLRRLAQGDRAGVDDHLEPLDDGGATILGQGSRVLARDGIAGGAKDGHAGDHLVGPDDGEGTNPLGWDETGRHGIDEDDVGRGDRVVDRGDGVGDGLAGIDGLGAGDGQGVRRDGMEAPAGNPRVWGWLDVLGRSRCGQAGIRRGGSRLGGQRAGLVGRNFRHGKEGVPENLLGRHGREKRGRRPCQGQIRLGGCGRQR